MCMFNKEPRKSLLAKPKRMWKIFEIRNGDLQSPFMGEYQPHNNWLTAVLRYSGYGYTMKDTGGFHVFKWKFLARQYWGKSRSNVVVLPVLVRGNVYGEDWRGMRVEQMFIPAPPASLMLRPPRLEQAGLAR